MRLVGVRLRLQHRQLRFHRAQPGIGAGHVLLRAGTDVRTRTNQPQRLALVVDVALGHIDAQLRAAQVEVITRDFGEQRHLRILQRRGARFGLRAGRFDRAAHAAEQIDLPAGIEAGAIAFGRHAIGGETRLLAAAALVVDIRSDGRPLVGASEAE